jgi:hypothetical protein
MSLSVRTKIHGNSQTRMVLTFEQIWLLTLLTLSYVLGELSHFLIGVTSRDVARTIHYGDLACFDNVTTTTTEDNDVFLPADDSQNNNIESVFSCSSHRNYSR